LQAEMSSSTLIKVAKASLLPSAQVTDTEEAAQEEAHAGGARGRRRSSAARFESSADEFERINGYSWDYCLVLKTPKKEVSDKAAEIVKALLAAGINIHTYFINGGNR
jgi:aspartate carbamoyltransferase catalytic subunit